MSSFSVLSHADNIYSRTANASAAAAAASLPMSSNGASAARFEFFSQNKFPSTNATNFNVNHTINHSVRPSIAANTAAFPAAAATIVAPPPTAATHASPINSNQEAWNVATRLPLSSRLSPSPPATAIFAPHQHSTHTAATSAPARARSLSSSQTDPKRSESSAVVAAPLSRASRRTQAQQQITAPHHRDGAASASTAHSHHASTISNPSAKLFIDDQKTEVGYSGRAVAKPALSANAVHAASLSNSSSVKLHLTPPFSGQLLAAKQPAHTDIDTPDATASGVAINSFSLNDKVAAALSDLEAIKRNSHRPSSANTMRSTPAVAFGGNHLQRPLTTSGELRVAAASSSQKPLKRFELESPSSDVGLSQTEQLSKAKLVVKKLYRKNLKLAQQVKMLRALSKRHMHLTNEHKESMENTMELKAAAEAEDGEAEDIQTAFSNLLDGDAFMDGDDSTDTDRLAEDNIDEQAGRAAYSGAEHDKSKQPFASSAAKYGASHLMLLLTQRDNTIQRLQQTLQQQMRKTSALAARLEAAGLEHGGNSINDTVVNGTSIQPSSILDDQVTNELYQKQLVELRESYKARLHQSIIANQSTQQIPSRFLSYVNELTQWLIWESSWRVTEKPLIHLALLKSENHAQDSYVRCRLLETQVQDATAHVNAQEIKQRETEKLLAQTLERCKSLEQELTR